MVALLWLYWSSVLNKSYLKEMQKNAKNKATVSRSRYSLRSLLICDNNKIFILIFIFCKYKHFFLLINTVQSGLNLMIFDMSAAGSKAVARGPEEIHRNSCVCVCVCVWTDWGASEATDGLNFIVSFLLRNLWHSLYVFTHLLFIPLQRWNKNSDLLFQPQQ